MHILTQSLLQALHNAKHHMDFYPPRPLHALSDLHNWHEILSLYEALEDNASKKTFLNLIILRTLYFTVPNDIVTDIYSLYPRTVWQKLLKLAENIPTVTGDYILDRVETWVLKGYEYANYKAEDGDFVIDAGAFTGNTSIYFAELVGPNGKVFAFEPIEKSFNHLKENTKNISQIELFQSGISHSDGQLYIAEQNHPGASLLQQGEVCVNIRSIDSFVQEQGIQRLDFIKMDIEGSERDALNGARKSITKFTPKLAVCIYHRPDDIFKIYKQIIEINKNYTFYLKHCSNTLWETVLFCIPSAKQHKYVDCSKKYAKDIAVAHSLRDLYKNIHECSKN